MHWTQRPEMRARMLANVKRSAAARKHGAAKKRKERAAHPLSGRPKSPEARANMRRAQQLRAERQRAAAGPMAGKRHTAASRKKISEAMRLHRAARLNGTMALHLNGHALTPPIPLTGKRLARAAVLQLAAAGARQQLAELDRQRDVLLIFIQATEKAER